MGLRTYFISLANQLRPPLRLKLNLQSDGIEVLDPPGCWAARDCPWMDVQPRQKGRKADGQLSSTTWVVVRSIEQRWQKVDIVLIHQLMNHALREYGCMMRCEHLTLTNVGSRKTDGMGILNEGPLECLRETHPYIGMIQVTRDRAIRLSRNSTCSSWSIICLFCCLLVSVKTSILTSKLFLRVLPYNMLNQ